MYSLIECDYSNNNLSKHIVNRETYCFYNCYCSGKTIKLMGIEMIIPDNVFISINGGSAIFDNDLPEEIFREGTLMGSKIKKIEFFNKNPVCINIGQIKDLKQFEKDRESSEYDNFFKVTSNCITFEFTRNGKLKSCYGFNKIAYNRDVAMETSTIISYYL